MTAGGNSVFIAYDLRDSDEAEALTVALEQAGLSVWLGWRDKAPAGSAGEYAEQLRGSAAGCGALVLLLSGSAGDLAERRDLTQRAYKAGKPIFVVRTDEGAGVPDFPALLGVTPADAFGPSRDTSLAALAQAIAAAIGPAEAAAPPAAPEPPATPPAPPAPTGSSFYAEPPTAPVSAAPPPADPHYAAPPAAPAYAPPPPPPPVYAAPPAPPAYAPPPPAPAYAPPQGAPAYAPSAPPLADDERSHLMRAFIGPNADFYLRKWEEMRVRNASTSWNWAAFLCSVFWLAYRRMFGLALMCAGALLAFQIIGPLFNGLVYILNGLSIGIAVAIGINGNRLYRQQAERVLAETQMTIPDPAARQTVLATRGGVSMPAALGLLVGWIVLVVGLSFVVTAVFHPHRSSYSSASTYGSPSSSSYGGGLSGSSDDFWLVGQWTATSGTTSPYCGTWIRFNGNHTLSDNAFSSGSWSLFGSGSSYTLTMTSSPGGTHSISVTRNGNDSMTMGSGSNTVSWHRATC